MWVRSNLHCHSANSHDGEIPVPELCRWYARRGYGLLAITDHNQITDLTTAQSDGSMLLVGRSVEIGYQTENILAIGIDELPDERLTVQEKLDAIARQGGMAILAHPNWRWNHWTADQLMLLQGYIGIEIVNTHMVECEGNEFALHIFDEILLRGKRALAFGNDDAHNFTDNQVIGRAWNEILVTRPTYADLMEAIRTGRFYVSTGAHIDAARLTGDRFTIDCPVESKVMFVVNGERVESCVGRRAEYVLRGGELYVRAEVTANDGTAYTQAVFPGQVG